MNGPQEFQTKYINPSITGHLITGHPIAGDSNEKFWLGWTLYVLHKFKFFYKMLQFANSCKPQELNTCLG